MKRGATTNTISAIHVTVGDEFNGMRPGIICERNGKLVFAITDTVKMEENKNASAKMDFPNEGEEFPSIFSLQYVMFYKNVASATENDKNTAPVNKYDETDDC